MEIKIYSTTAANTNTVDVAMPAGATIEDLFTEASVQAQFDATEDELREAFEEIDGDEVPESFAAMIVKGALEDGKSYGFGLDFAEDDEGREDEGGVPQAPAERTVGAVEVWLFGGLVTIQVPVVNGVTKVSDVMMHGDVLERTQQSPQMLANSIIEVNGNVVPNNMAHNVALKNGDRVSLTARVAKDGGIKG